MLKILGKRKNVNPCLVITKNQNSWVIGGLIREAAKSIGRNFDIFYVVERRLKLQNPIHYMNFFRIGKRNKVLFAHQKLFIRYVDSYKPKSKAFKVFVTHLSGTDLVNLARYDQFVSTYLVMNSEVERKLYESGISKSKIVKVYGAVDEKLYYPTGTSKNYVLIVGKYSARKNGDTIKQVVSSNPNIEFIIHGDGWGEVFNKTVLPNLRIYPFEISRNPKLLSESSCLLSISEIEGGPITVLEALSCGIPVVGSNTGFIPELIKGNFGLLVNDHLDIKEISQCLIRILDNLDLYRGDKLLEIDVSFSRFGKQILNGW